MDKTERIIDMTEHPERYSEDELRQLLVNDDEGRRIYKTISELNAAFGMEARKHDGNTSTVSNIRFWKKTAAVFIGICLLSGIAYAAVSTGLFTARHEEKAAGVADTTVVVPTEVRRNTPVAERVETVRTYDDVTLDKILADIAATYGVAVEYKSDGARLLRLYFKFDASRGLERAVSELNTFDNISITIQEKKLIVE